MDNSNIIETPNFVLASPTATDEQKARTNMFFKAGILKYNIQTGEFSFAHNVNVNIFNN